MNRLRRIVLDRSPHDLQRLTKIYDEQAPTWDQREGRGEKLVIGNAWRDQLARSLEGDVLEIGVGTGETLRRLQEVNAPVRSFTGIDLSTGMLAEASRYVDACAFPVTLRQMNAEMLTAFADNTFDSVTASLVLCTVPDPAMALREMARVCKPDGRIVLIEHVLANNPIVGGVQKIVAPIQERHMGCHIDRTTHQLVRDLGFRVEQDDSRVFGIVHLMVARPPGA